MAEYKVVDISKFQGAVDFNKLKADGVHGVIIRCGYTGYGKSKSKNTDSRWEENCKAAQKAGMPFGAYYYSCAVTPEEAEQEAQLVLKLIEGKTLLYPVYFDTEDNHDIAAYSPESQLSIGRSRLTAVAKAFLEVLSKKGICCGIYASKSWLENQLDMQQLSGCEVWVAQYAEKLTYKGEYRMWQYTSEGTVNGIEGKADLNHCYVDYPSLLKSDDGILQKGDSSMAVLAYKMLLASAKEHGIITQGVDDNCVFGEGTHRATLQLQAAAGLAQSGTADSGLIIAAKALINERAALLKSKISKAVQILQ